MGSVISAVDVSTVGVVIDAVVYVVAEQQPIIDTAIYTEIVFQLF